MSPLLLLGIAAGALVLLKDSKGRIANAIGTVSTFTDSSGHPWKVALVSNAEPKAYDVYAPAGSWGPHGDMAVLRYAQQGSDLSSRHLLSIYPEAPAATVAAAKTFFGV